ncbi:hypothetical protein ANRL4_01193 [Anaerolineae bacterium]|nr:hypothetical protein ANRL4_01193 [Anaerolineae bacterium]
MGNQTILLPQRLFDLRGMLRLVLADAIEQLLQRDYIAARVLAALVQDLGAHFVQKGQQFLPRLRQAGQNLRRLLGLVLFDLPLVEAANATQNGCMDSRGA